MNVQLRARQQEDMGNGGEAALSLLIYTPSACTHLPPPMIPSTYPPPSSHS